MRYDDLNDNNFAIFAAKHYHNHKCIIVEEFQEDLNRFKYKYYFKRSFDIILTILVTDSLIKFFANNKLLLLPLRRFSFLLLNKFILIRRMVLNHMTKSLIYLSIK